MRQRASVTRSRGAVGIPGGNKSRCHCRPRCWLRRLSVVGGDSLRYRRNPEGTGFWSCRSGVEPTTTTRVKPVRICRATHSPAKAGRKRKRKIEGSLLPSRNSGIRHPLALIVPPSKPFALTQTDNINRNAGIL